MKRIVMGLAVMMAATSAFASASYVRGSSPEIRDPYQPCKELARAELADFGGEAAGAPTLRLVASSSKIAPIMTFRYEMDVVNGPTDTIGMEVTFNQFTGKCAVK